MEGRAELLELLRGQVPDERVLAAIAAVPRELFVPPDLRERAWENVPLPIGRGQTISQPLVVARMLAVLAVRPGDRILDVGTGSGWHAALLARLGGRVWSVERHAELVEYARQALAAAGVRGVTLVHGDGSAGLPEAAPFNAINVAAAARARIPPALQAQLAAGGRLVAPVGNGEQRLVVLTRTAAGETRRRELEAVRFVPLVSS
jgi:protein-L-isoaspartate(D-aspartate) O-methyltransferase